MSKVHRALYTTVLETLKGQNCISDYSVDGQNATPEWREGGFDRALHELANNPKPFGLKKKGERAVLMLVLTDTDKEKVDALIIGPLLKSLA